MATTERIETVIIGAGQSGLSVGYHLARRGLPFVILEASRRVGDVWRQRWDSLRLFTPARYDGLVGLPFPAPAHSFPTKDEMGDYLEAYAQRFELPVRTGVRVDRLSRRGGNFLIVAGDQEIEASNVVVAMATFQRSRVPEWAKKLDSAIVQVHSADYRNPNQLSAGDVLVVGAGNSGADIALELARAGHRTSLSGRDTGEVPVRIDSWLARHVVGPFLTRFVFHRVLTLGTPMGRKARPRIVSKGGPRIRVKSRDLASAGVTRVARTVGVKNGMPLLEDGRTLNVSNVVWCTGFDAGHSWIDLPVFGPDGEPVHYRGVVTQEPGLYFVGLHFLYAMSSTMIHGAARDARHVANAMIARSRKAAA